MNLTPDEIGIVEGSVRIADYARITQINADFKSIASAQPADASTSYINPSCC